jgi:hypothetical protein
MGDPLLIVDLDLVHSGEIYYESASTNTMTSGVVPASAYGHLKLVSPREIKGDRDILRAHAPCNHCRTTVDEGIEAAACCIIPGICRKDDGPSQ